MSIINYAYIVTRKTPDCEDTDLAVIEGRVSLVYKFIEKNFPGYKKDDKRRLVWYSPCSGSEIHCRRMRLVVSEYSKFFKIRR